MAEQIEISDRTVVVFVLPDGVKIEVSIRLGELRVESDSGKLVIRPEASNLVRVTAAK